MLSIAVEGARATPVPPRFEVSANGLQTAFLDAPEPATLVSATVEGPTPVFGSVPDWSNTIRRQVDRIRTAGMDNDGDLDLVAVCYFSMSFPPYEDWHNFIYFNDGSLEAGNADLKRHPTRKAFGVEDGRSVTEVTA